MASYYQLRLSSDPSIIGVRNGIQQLEIHGLSKEIVSFFAHEVIAAEKFLEPPFKVSFPAAKLLERAIITDFLSYGPFLTSCPFVISEAVVKVLALFNAQSHRFYDLNTINGEVVENLKIFYCPAQAHSAIDFQHSVFFSGSTLIGKKYLKFSDVDEYKNFLSSNQAVIVRAERLALSPTVDGSLDLIVLKFGGVYVSSRLRCEILRLGLTGVNFIPCFNADDEDGFIHLRY